VIQHQRDGPPALLGPAAEAAGLDLDARIVEEGAEILAEDHNGTQGDAHVVGNA